MAEPGEPCTARSDRPLDALRRVAIVIQQNPMSHLNTQKLHGVLEFIRRNRRWRTRLFDANVDPAEVVEWRPDGAIVARDLLIPGATGPRKTGGDGDGFPVVYSYDSPERFGSYTVSQDDVAIGELAANYFLERGYRKFAFVGLRGRVFSDGRGDAFEQRVTAHKLPFERIELTPPKYPDRPPLPRELAKLPGPLAVFCANDTVALSALEVCRRNDRAVPQEVAVLGVDDLMLQCELAEPTLSSVVHPQSRVGYAAAQMLERLMNGEEPPVPHLRMASPGVHTRRSTETTAVEDPLVSDAIRWMVSRIERPLTVAEAADTLGVSRNTLHRRFVTTLGHGMKREHRRQQILRAKELLRRTEDSLADIAISCGFNDAAHFSRTFREVVDKTPGQFRNEANGDIPRPMSESDDEAG